MHSLSHTDYSSSSSPPPPSSSVPLSLQPSFLFCPPLPPALEETIPASMSASPAVDFSFLNLTVFSDGSIHRAPYDPPPVPASPSPASPHDVATFDLTFSHTPATGIRLFLPPHPAHNLPILLFFHGGGFVYGSSTLPAYHTFLCKLAAHARVLIVAVDYRLAPEHPLPTAYSDGMEALQWLSEQGKLASEASASENPWLAKHGDFSRCFLGGDSAGANIAHHVMMGAVTGLGFDRESWCATRSETHIGTGKTMEGLCLQGVIYIHAFFTCGEGEVSELEAKLFKLGGVGVDHPFANPLCSEAPSLVRAALPNRILVAIASKDMLAQRGLAFYKGLTDSGKAAKLFISEDEDHVFFLLTPNSKSVLPFLDELSDFINNH